MISRVPTPVLCQGVSTSLKKLLTAVKNGQTELFRGCGDEIVRCISDLIDLYDGDGSNAVTVLSNVSVGITAFSSINPWLAC